MGYNTTFRGSFLLNKILRPEHKAYLRRFSEMQHVALDEERLKNYPDPLREVVGLPIGKNGMYFTGLIDPDEGGNSLLLYSLSFDKMEALDNMEAIMQSLLEHARGFPSARCQWVPTYNSWGIEWDQGDKFYGYVEWLRFLIEHFLLPWGYELSGTVSYEGEQGEHGRIIVTNNEVSVVIDGDSTKPRSEESPEVSTVIKVYWMTVGSLSAAVRKALLEADCFVLDLHDDPPVVLVGLPYDINYYKRHGYDDLALYTTEGIRLHSKKLRLYWDTHRLKNKAWEGEPTTKLVLYDEQWEEDPVDLFDQLDDPR
jgi:hypothetical protein